MISFPNAKINLGLHVIEKRHDGFHTIETIFYPVSLCDVLEIIPSENGKTEFTSSGIPVPGAPGDNLVLKAVNLLMPLIGNRKSKIENRKSKIENRKSKIHLHKVIPPGSGLGGGSADAAFTIRMLNDLWKLELTISGMQELAGKIGSDCAFFIENKPVFATGKGDEFEPLDLNLSEFKITTEAPPVVVSTREAYRMIIPKKTGIDLREIIRSPFEQWKDSLKNDFEEVMIRKYPVIGELKERMYAEGAVFASMTGSGSAVFGIFRK